MVKKSILLIAAVVIFGGGAFAINMASNQNSQITDLSPKATDEMVQAEMSATGFLDYDIVIGDKDAPIEIIEYVAISCSHCADFHENVYPVLKKKYLDTGKAKLVYRNFIFDNPFDVFAATMTRCVAEEDFLPTVEVFFDTQRDWNKLSELKRIFEAGGKDAAVKFAQDEVAKIGITAGISEKNARQCFDNQAVVNYLLDVRRTAYETYQVNSTPTLIVNGKKLDHNDMATLVDAIESTEK